MKNPQLEAVARPDLQFVCFVEIRGTDRSDARELHIAYRYGEHYDSVRTISDDSETPANLRMEVGCDGVSQLGVTNRAGLCCLLVPGSFGMEGRAVSVCCAARAKP